MSGFGMMGGTPRHEPGDVRFHPLSARELTGGTTSGLQLDHLGLAPMHKSFLCGACGDSTNGRVLCDVIRKIDGARILWCLCSCEKEEPTILVENGDMITSRYPTAVAFRSAPGWPCDLKQLYEEAAKAFAAGAFTASAMVCRKLLMATACQEGAQDGQNFVSYVHYITDTILAFPKAKAAIDRIRDIGNDANHKVAFVSASDAERALQIVTYMLSTIYSLPTA